MKVCYVAGPYRSKAGPHDFYGTLQNIRAAEAVAIDLWRMGIAALCPHKNTACFDGAVEGDEIWLEGALEMMKRCDIVVMTPGWRESSGARKEYEVAEERGIPIYEYDRDYWLLKALAQRGRRGVIAG